MVTKMKAKGLVLMALASVLSINSKAQVSGTVTVPSTTYPTLDAVITALNTQGVGASGATINVTAPQTAPTGGYRLGSTTLNPTLTSSSPLVINGNGNTITAYQGQGGADGMFTLMGADYVTINQLNLLDNNATTNYNFLMDWGYGFVKLNNAGTNDGCQYNTISNCNISLSRDNATSPTEPTNGSAPGAGAAFGGSKGIAFMNVVMPVNSTDLLVQLNLTKTEEANSYNTVKGCNIQNCNIGVYMYGFNDQTSPFALYDQNNTIGGYGANAGNTITNFGGGSVNESAGIYIVGYQNNAFVRGNTINNTANGGIVSAGALDGIYHGAAKGSNVTVSKNNITLTQGAVTPALQGICIANGGTNANQVSVDSNTMTLTGNGSSHGTIGYNFASTGTTANLSCKANQLSITTASVGGVIGFYFGHASIGSNSVWDITDNKINSINRTANGGNVYGFSQGSGVLPGTQINLLRNRVSNFSSPTTNNPGLINAGFSFTGGSSSPYAKLNIAYDTVTNVSMAAGYFSALSLTSAASGSTINNCLFTDLTTNGQLAGFYTTGSVYPTSFYNNTISNLTNTNTGTWGTYGLSLGLGANQGMMDVYNNNISNLQTANATPGNNNQSGVIGINVGSALTVNMYNNMISDLRAPSASGFSPVYGIYINGASTNNTVYHNTINIGVGGAQLTSSGANFGATGIFMYTNAGYSAKVDLRNNIVRVNAAAQGTGVVAALRTVYGISGTNTALQPASNGNILWVPGDAQMYVFAEGTSLTGLVNAFTASDLSGTCSNYKKFMNPAESNTFYESNLYQVGSLPVYTPSGQSFAKNNAVPTSNPAVTTDYNNVTRPTPADAGALQFTGTAYDLVGPSISFNPIDANTYCVSAPTLTATITDASGVNTTTNAPRLYYRKTTEADAFGNYPNDNTSSFNGWKYVTATNSGNNFSFSIDYSKLTAGVAGGDSIVYFVIAQDNNSFSNVSINQAGLASGYCLTGVNLPPAAGPTRASVVKNGYYILPQPALPTVTPASASVCSGSGTMLTAVPYNNPNKAVSVGNQADTNNYASGPTPFGNFYGAAHQQYLVLASELISQGLTEGNISSLAFNQATGYIRDPLSSYSIKMANSTVSSMPNTLITTGFTNVYSPSSYTPPATAGWAPVTFTTPFYWDGVSNIIVDVSFSNCTSSAKNGNGIVYRTPTSFTSVLGYAADNNCTINTFTPVGGTHSNSNTRPDMKFVGTQAYKVNWAPITGLYKDAGLTQPIAATDTNRVVYAAPSATQSYATMNLFSSGCNSIPGTASTVTVNALPTVTTTPANTASFCGGSNATINGSTGTGYTYQWKNGNNIVATTAAYTATATGTYTFTATNANGCSASASVVVSNAAPPTATATAAGSTTFCQGSSVTINANTGAGLTYQWYNNGNVISNATSSSYVATTSGSYSVNVYNAANCFTTSNAIAVTVNPLNTTITSSGATTFCPGMSTTLSVPAAAGQTYQWNFNGTPINGQTNPSLSVSAAGNYTVTVSNAGLGCTSTSTATTIALGTPTASIASTGSTTVCDGNAVTLTTTPATGVTYQWLKNGTPIGGANDTVYAATTSGNYSLQVSAGAGCTGTSSAINVVVNPRPSVATTPAAGPATVCQNGSTILSVPSASNVNYQWSFNGNPINGATSYNYSAGNAGTYKVYVTNTQTGCADTSGNIVLTQLASPAIPVISGNSAICAGGVATLSTTPVSGLNYQWRNASNTIAGATSATYQANTAGNYMVVATNSNGCSATSNVIGLVVNPLPNVTTTPASSAILCQGYTDTLSVVAGANQTYQWNNGGVAINGASNRAYVANTAATYSVTVTNTQTGCTATSGNIVVTQHALPTVSISGATTACMGDSVTYTASATPGSTYQWQLNGTNVQGATGTTLKYPLTGAYTVVVTDPTTSCFNTSNTINLTLNNLPIANITGQNSICSGDTATLVVGSAANQTYQWKANNSNIPGANANVYKTQAGGVYAVKVTNTQTGCSNTSFGFPVTVNARPTPAIVNNQSGLSVTSTFNTYQWYLNNSPIPGATSQTYKPTVDGDYYVVVTAGGCSGKSNVITMTGVGVHDVTASGVEIHVYPNPTTGLLNIDAPGKVNVVIRDMAGKLIKTATEVQQIDLGDVAAGIYMMSVSDTNGMLLKVEKVSKTQ